MHSLSEDEKHNGFLKIYKNKIPPLVSPQRAVGKLELWYCFEQINEIPIYILKLWLYLLTSTLQSILSRWMPESEELNNQNFFFYICYHKTDEMNVLWCGFDVFESWVCLSFENVSGTRTVFEFYKKACTRFSFQEIFTDQLGCDSSVV